MVFAQFVLICPLHIVTAGLNKKHVLRVAALLEQQNHSGNARAEEQLLRQADDRIQQVLLNERLADASFAAAPEEHAMRRDDAHSTAVFLCALDHVANESVVALALGRHPPCGTCGTCPPPRFPHPTCPGRRAGWLPPRRTS